MHCHTRFSDGQATPEQVRDVCRKLGIGACITDHNEIRGSIELWRHDEVVTLPAIEIGSSEGFHFLVYFNDPAPLERFFMCEVEPYKRRRWYAKLSRSWRYTLPAAKDEGALICFPHPYSPGWLNLDFNHRRRLDWFSEETQKFIDCIEVVNGAVHYERNEKAAHLCEVLGKEPMVGSDSHYLPTLGTATTDFDEPVTRRSLFDLLIEHSIQVNQTRNPIRYKLGTAWHMASRYGYIFASRKRRAQWQEGYEPEHTERESGTGDGYL